jgi:multiple sugar transport system permease protein
LQAVALFPFAVMLSTALKSVQEVTAYPPRWLPAQLVWSNFSDMWQAAGFGRALFNSILISISATLLTIVIAVPAAYATSRLPFRGRGTYRMFLLFTQMLSPILLVLGIFRMATAIPFGDGTLVDTRLGVIIVYSAYQLALAVWMLSSYFSTIPREMEEAAWLDGASRATAAVASLFRWRCRPLQSLAS